MEIWLRKRVRNFENLKNVVTTNCLKIRKRKVRVVDYDEIILKSAAFTSSSGCVGKYA